MSSTVHSHPTPERPASLEPAPVAVGSRDTNASDGAKRAGCDSFVTKPCLPDDLVVEMRRMLNAVSKQV
jgi:CheY-like chemotaxis protein